MKEFGARQILAAIILIMIAILAFAIPGYDRFIVKKPVIVGFIYDNDETTPYSYNFYQAQKALQETYGDKVRTVMYSNILDEEIGDPVRKLAAQNCDIIFTNSYGNIRAFADEYPDIEFCQVSSDPYPEEEARPNYHTFKGEIYQGRYLSGVVAGLKLKEMIDDHKITPEEARVGFVAAYPYPEVISGFTAFILGVRSVVPEAVEYIKYTKIWSSYTLENACARELLDEGCVIISQHSDTVGPAIACEEYYSREIYHVGYNIDMTEDAPNSSLTSARINWEPYIIKATEAVMKGKPIEKWVEGKVHPLNDMSAGFERNWIDLTPLNESLVPKGAKEYIDSTMEGLKTGRIRVFEGDYHGVSPDNPLDTVDLKNGFTENDDSSISTFHYILDDVVIVEP